MELGIVLAMLLGAPETLAVLVIAPPLIAVGLLMLWTVATDA